MTEAASIPVPVVAIGSIETMSDGRVKVALPGGEGRIFSPDEVILQSLDPVAAMVATLAGAMANEGVLTLGELVQSPEALARVVGARPVIAPGPAPEGGA